MSSSARQSPVPGGRIVWPGVIHILMESLVRPYWYISSTRIFIRNPEGHCKGTDDPPSQTTTGVLVILSAKKTKQLKIIIYRIP